ncbi:hypothetical protein ACFCYM_29915 [Streptomyces sp. NPDC056254]|uniref:hypothetical protein n=1 Tax=Streptomyces sp. NPDC056254 TaxID=3345763 RepID=UPI0035E1B4B9
MAADLWGEPVTPAYSSLTRALADALVDVAWFIDGADDEQMDPDDAVKALEGIGATLGRLSHDQRSELLGVLGAMAEAEGDAVRREFLSAFPGDFGLLDE